MRSALVGALLALYATTIVKGLRSPANHGYVELDAKMTRDVQPDKNDVQPDKNDDDSIVYTLWEAHPGSKRKRDGEVEADKNDDESIVYTLWEAHPDSKKKRENAEAEDANDDDGIVYTLWEAHPDSKKV